MSKSHRRNNFATLAGIALFIAILLLLLTTPRLLFSPVISFIDTDIYKSSGSEATVSTKTDLGNQEHMAAFPREIGKWVGYDYDTTKYVELLGADVMLLRYYEPSTFTQPLFFLILQAKTESSFHPPEVCVRAQGSEIQEEGDEKVVVTEANWVKGPSSITIPLKKLVVTKSSKDGKIIERRVLLFCYVKGNQFYSDTITMIQVEALAPLTGSYDGSLNEEKDFISQAIPLLFEPVQVAEWHPLVMVLLEQGTIGYFVIAFLLFLPVGIIVYSRVQQQKDVDPKSEPEK